jgi:hypothetical protein
LSAIVYLVCFYAFLEVRQIRHVKSHINHYTIKHTCYSYGSIYR